MNIHNASDINNSTSKQSKKGKVHALNINKRGNNTYL